MQCMRFFSSKIAAARGAPFAAAAAAAIVSEATYKPLCVAVSRVHATAFGCKK